MPNPPNRATSGLRRWEELPHTCAKCRNRWSGANTSHCANCHETFSGVTTFDKHRDKGQCKYPANVELTLDAGLTRAYRCWGTIAEIDLTTPTTTP